VKELSRFEKFIAGLHVMNAYEDKEMFAERDVFGVSVDLSSEDAFVIGELGWNWSDYDDCWIFYV